MNREVIFELSAETLQACLAAGQGGAARIELCSALSEDGLTPSHSLIEAAVQRSGLPIHVLLRPRSGGFVYTADEFALIREDLLHARSLGVSGFVVGVLHPDATVDIERTRELVDLAGALETTFHRAFDLTPSFEQALEDVIATGCRRLLTSGGASDVVAGAPTLARLVDRAAGRIDVAPGGGLRVENAATIARITHASHFHGSMRRRRSAAASAQRSGVLSSAEHDVYIVDSEDIRAVIRELRLAESKI